MSRRSRACLLCTLVRYANEKGLRLKDMKPDTIGYYAPGLDKGWRMIGAGCFAAAQGQLQVKHVWLKVKSKLPDFTKALFAGERTVDFLEQVMAKMPRTGMAAAHREDATAYNNVVPPSRRQAVSEPEQHGLSCGANAVRSPT